MTTFERDDITLHKLDDYVWELPQEGGMNVPGRVFASEALLEEIAGDKTLSQLRNSAHLPGMTKYAICMPDGHQGYGFPVGGVGAIDAENGCISPGAIGYDINCLTGDAEILLEWGRRREIEALREEFPHHRAMVAGETREPATLHLYTETEEARIYEVTTTEGDTITATADHPFLTDEDMTELHQLEPGDSVYVSPFRGVPDEEPAEFVVLEESDLDDADPQLLNVLSDRDLLPLRSTDPAFNILLKLVGYHTGDGSFSESEGKTWFYGSKEDLERIQEDIERVGFTPSQVCERDRSHKIDGDRFETTEYSVRSTSRAFMRLVKELGAPAGKKVESEFTHPWYFERLAGWQKALYLSTFFGAEMSRPAAISDKNLQSPTISHNRSIETASAGRSFLAGIAGALSDLGIRTTTIEESPAANRPDDRVHLRLGVRTELENLIRFFETVGYRYNREKERAAIKAVQYLKFKRKVIEDRQTVADGARMLADGGGPVSGLKRIYPEVNGRFSERSVSCGRADSPRPPLSFPGFEEYCEQVEVRENGCVESTIESIDPAGSAPVYDLGVSHPEHNFIANGFVVSNCGVRLMKTNLSRRDLDGREEELVDSLFANIPSGLGGGGVIETDVETVDKILTRGVKWAVDEGWGIESDLTHCEDEGFRPEADPNAVSQRAKDRGKNQVGSLGSGNHFLEVQCVDEVILDEVGETFGLWEDQIVVLIHCGSRGLGHQVCTDYLRKIEKEHSDLLSRLPDKELAAAPAGSRLADEYYHAMGAAINFAWVNRQLVMHRTRQVFERVFNTAWENLGMELLYDVAHNIGKKEVHEVDGEERELYVHRKGATRAFPAGRPELPQVYRDVGQPVIIPGSMGTSSYVLRGGERSLDLSFGSTAHGAGRLMSRTRAKKEYWGGDVQDDLRDRQRIYVKAQSGATIAEEAPGVYKDVDEVVRVSDALGIGDTVARLFPVCNIKG